MGVADIPGNEGWGRVHLDSLFDPTVLRTYRDQTQVLASTGQFVS
jgi:hypothetical protein